jgi:hypothetical protein
METFICQFCFKQFPTNKKKSDHRTSCSQTPQTLRRCSQCDVIKPTIAKLRDHMKTECAHSSSLSSISLSSSSTTPTPSLSSTTLSGRLQTRPEQQSPLFKPTLTTPPPPQWNPRPLLPSPTYSPLPMHHHVIQPSTPLPYHWSNRNPLVAQKQGIAHLRYLSPQMLYSPSHSAIYSPSYANLIPLMSQTEKVTIPSSTGWIPSASSQRIFDPVSSPLHLLNQTTPPAHCLIG